MICSPVAIFPRRIIQQELDSLRPHIIGPSQEKDIITRLNGRERQAISTEWEVVLAAAFARNANVRYEPSLGGKRPDLFISAADNSIEFVIDIVAVSDEESDRKNPAYYFFEEFRRVAAKCGLAGGFDIRIGDRLTGNWPDKVNRLLLPSKKEIPRFIKCELANFMRSILLSPTERHTYRRADEGIDLQIMYDPAQLGRTTGGFAGYNAAYSLTRNPLFAALNSKAKKLRQSGYAGIKGIIVVDGGCHVLRANQRAGGSPWSCGEIVEHFLKRHKYVDFVTITYYEDTLPILGNRRQLFRHRVFWQRPFDQAKIDSVYPLLNDTFKSLPSPAESPQNALASVRSRRRIDQTVLAFR